MVWLRFLPAKWWWTRYSAFIFNTNTTQNRTSYLHFFIRRWLFLRFFWAVSLILLLILISLHLALMNKYVRPLTQQLCTYSTPVFHRGKDGLLGLTCSSFSFSLACSVSMGSSVSSAFWTSTKEALDTLKMPWMFTRTLTFTLELSPDACGTTFWIRNWPVRSKIKETFTHGLNIKVGFMQLIGKKKRIRGKIGALNKFILIWFWTHQIQQYWP